MNKTGFIFLIATFMAFAHGVNVEYTVDSVINVSAQYEDKKAFAGADVDVFLKDGDNAIYSGKTDDSGNFSFSHSSKETKGYDVRIRKAGHGKMIYIPSIETAGDTSISMVSKAISALLVIWALVATALYVNLKLKKERNKCISPTEC